MMKHLRMMTLFLAICFLLSAPVYAQQAADTTRDSSLFLGIVFLILLAAVFLPLWRKLQETRRDCNRLRKMIDRVDAGVLSLFPDANYSIDYVNEGFFKLLGLPDSSVRLASGSLNEYLHPEDVPTFHAIVEEARMYGGKLAVELRLQSFDGYIPILLRGTLMQENTRMTLRCVLVDYSDHQNLLSLLNAEHERYSLIIEQTDDIIFDFDLEEGSVVTSSKYTQRFTSPPVLPEPDQWALFADIIHAEDAQKVSDMYASFQMGAEKQNCRVRLSGEDGHPRWYDIFLSQISKDGKPIRYVGKLVDVHEQVLEFEWMEMKVHTDPMTGVLNKEAFYLRADEHLSRCMQSDAVLFVDLDRFKQLNDTLGHIIGDRVLLDVALKIQECFRRDDLIARFGGDEFCVLAKGISLDQVLKKAAQLVQALQLTYTDEAGQSASISASVGIALAPQHGLLSAQVLDCADKALYAAKENGRNQFQIYEPAQMT